jgi:hypothetical protein
VTEFGPVRPFGGEFPPINPVSADPRVATEIPDGSITDSKVAAGISPKKLAMIGAKVYMAAAQAITTGSTGELLGWDTEVFDQGNFWTSGETMAVPETGVYIIAAVVEFASDGTGEYRRAHIQINATDCEGATTKPLTGVATRFTITTVRKLTAGDTIGVRVAHDKGSNLNANGGEESAALSAVFLGAI